MPSDRKPSLTLPATVAMLLLLGIYVGSYYVTVVPPTRLRWQGDEIALYRMVGGSTFSEQARRHRRWHTFFAPIHWIDRRLRSDMWDKGGAFGFGGE